MLKDITFEWNETKNDWLKHNRGVSFEDVVISIQNNKARAVVKSKTRRNQWLYIVEMNGYGYVVPFVKKSTSVYFLKTIYPSRKATKRYVYN